MTEQPIPDIFSSPVFTVVVQLDHDGFQFRLTPDGRVEVRPISRLPADVRALFVEHQADLRLIVAVATDPGVHERRDAFRRLIDAAAPGTLPACLSREGISYRAGVCFSCGDALPDLHFGRCWRCSVAWRLSAGVPVPSSLADALDTARVAG